MSIRNLVGARSDWSVSLSPDARVVAYVSDRAGVPQITLLENDGTIERTVDTGPDPVHELSFSHDGAWLAFSSAPGASPRTNTYVIRPDGTDLRQLRGPATGASYLGPWTHEANLLALSHSTDPPAGVCELVRADIGERREVTRGGQPLLLDVDRNLRRALVRRGPRGLRSLWLVDLDRHQEVELSAGFPPGTSDFGRLSPDGSRAFLRSSAGRDAFSLFEVALDDPSLAFRPLAERAGAELEYLISSSDGRTLALLWNRAGQSECELLDLASGVTRLLLLPEPLAHGGSFSHDGRFLALTLEGPTHPRAIHLLDTETGVWRQLTSQPSSWTRPRSTPELVRFRASDGLELTAYLYRASAPEQAPRAALIHLHGGPEAQERPAYNPLFQALVERGISVLAPNVRGSSGFGKAFMEADNRERRWAAIADVASCAQYLFAHGLASPETLACGGRSYGGYLTLATLVFSPELFAAGLDVCGMSDLRTFYRDTEPWIAVSAYPKYGHPVEDAELLRQLSPLPHFENLRAPLLIVHGKNDSNVPLGEALQAASAARCRGVAVELLLFDNEGHELAQRENREIFVTKSVEFLERVLHGS